MRMLCLIGIHDYEIFDILKYINLSRCTRCKKEKITPKPPTKEYRE